MLPVDSIVGELSHYRPKHVELIAVIEEKCYCCIYLALYFGVYLGKTTYQQYLRNGIKELHFCWSCLAGLSSEKRKYQ